MPKNILSYDCKSIIAADAYTAYAIMYIYQDYIKASYPKDVLISDVLLCSFLSSYLLSQHSEEFYENNKETIEYTLQWFYKHRDIIEAWYIESNLSYQPFFHDIIKTAIEKALEKLLTSIFNPEPNFSCISRYLALNPSLQEVLSVYDYLEEANKFSSHLQITKNLEQSTQLAIKATACIIRKKLLPIIEQTVSQWLQHHSTEAHSLDKFKNYIIYLFLGVSFESVYGYAYRVRKSENYSNNEKAGTVLYWAQIKFYLLPYLQKKFNYSNSPFDPYQVLEELEQTSDALCVYSNSYPQETCYGEELLLLEDASNFYWSIHDEAIIDSMTSKAAITFQYYMEKLLYPKIEEGRRIFGSMFGSTTTPMDILRAYLYLFMYKNTVANRSNVLLGKLIESTYGDIQNHIENQDDEGYISKDESYITKEDLTFIFQQNPELKDYLIAFKAVFYTVEDFFRSDSCTQNKAKIHFEKIREAIEWHESHPLETIDEVTSNSQENAAVYNHSNFEALAYCCQQVDNLTRLPPSEDIAKQIERDAQVSAFQFFIKHGNTPDNALYEFIKGKGLLIKPTLPPEYYDHFFQHFIKVFYSPKHLGIYTGAIQLIIANDRIFKELWNMYKNGQNNLITVTIWMAQKFEKLEELNININTGATGEVLLQNITSSIIAEWEKSLNDFKVYASFTVCAFDDKVKERKLNKYQNIKRKIEEIKPFFSEDNSITKKLKSFYKKVSEYISHLENLPAIENSSTASVSLSRK